MSNKIVKLNQNKKTPNTNRKTDTSRRIVETILNNEKENAKDFFETFITNMDTLKKTAVDLMMEVVASGVEPTNVESNIYAWPMFNEFYTNVQTSGQPLITFEDDDNSYAVIALTKEEGIDHLNLSARKINLIDGKEYVWLVNNKKWQLYYDPKEDADIDDDEEEDVPVEFYTEATKRQQIILNRYDDAERDFLIAVMKKYNRPVTDEEYEKEKNEFLCLVEFGVQNDMRFSNIDGEILLHSEEKPGFALGMKDGKIAVYQFMKPIDIQYCCFPEITAQNYVRFAYFLNDETELWQIEEAEHYEYSEEYDEDYDESDYGYAFLPLSNDFLVKVDVEELEPDNVFHAAVAQKDGPLTKEEKSLLDEYKKWYEESKEK